MAMTRDDIEKVLAVAMLDRAGEGLPLDTRLEMAAPMAQEALDLYKPLYAFFLNAQEDPHYGTSLLDALLTVAEEIMGQAYEQAKEDMGKGRANAA